MGEERAIVSGGTGVAFNDGKKKGLVIVRRSRRMAVRLFEYGALVILGTKDDDRLEEAISGSKLGGIKGIGNYGVNSILAAKDEGELIIAESGSDTIGSIKSMIVEILAGRLIGCLKDNSSELNIGSRKTDNDTGSSLPASGESIGSLGRLGDNASMPGSTIIFRIELADSWWVAIEMKDIDSGTIGGDGTRAMTVNSHIDFEGEIGSWCGAGCLVIEKADMP